MTDPIAFSCPDCGAELHMRPGLTDALASHALSALSLAEGAAGDFSRGRRWSGTRKLEELAKVLGDLAETITTEGGR